VTDVILLPIKQKTLLVRTAPFSW